NSLNEPILQKIEKISDVLKNFEGQSLINIDRSWFYCDTFLDKLKTYPSLNQVLLKSPVKKELLEMLRDSGLNVMYMPIIKTIEELDFVLSFEGINTVAVELVFQDLENPIISKKVIDDLHEKGLLIWVNALTLSDSIILSA
ncbi:glycerophosphodiester phosphodiesterase, partial [Streptococcus pneumoniae]|nr:glycerophosphodiester phosphodiesterase [Streptococcus pneumoniae]